VRSAGLMREQFTKHGPWFVTRTCAVCGKSLSEYDTYFRDGVCPHCGYRDPYGHVAYTTNAVVRRVYRGPRWLFWLPLLWRVFASKSIERRSDAREQPE
jgi:hypothetical protein